MWKTEIIETCKSIHDFVFIVQMDFFSELRYSETSGALYLDAQLRNSYPPKQIISPPFPMTSVDHVTYLNDCT